MITLSLVVVSVIFAGCGKNEVAKDANNTQIKETSSKINELELKNGERFFKSEVAPKSEAEKVILESFKVNISDEYDKLSDLYIDAAGSVEIYKEICKEKFKDGLYTEQVTIHNLKKLTKEEYTNKSNGKKYYGNIDRLNKLNPKELEVIEVDYTIKLTDKENKIAQWGNGDWVRYYVVVKETEKENWKIFEEYGYM